MTDEVKKGIGESKLWQLFDPKAYEDPRKGRQFIWALVFLVIMIVIVGLREPRK